MKSTIVINNTNKLTIESINDKQAAKVRSSWNESIFYQYTFNSGVETISADRTLQFIARINHCEETIGYIQVYTTNTPSILWIQSIAIHEEHLQKGYGTMLYHQVIEHLASHFSINRIYLACHNNNHIGLNFWESLGFEQDLTITYHKNHAVIMMTQYESQGERFE